MCTDSVACVPPDDVEELGIEVVPLPVQFGPDSYRDGVDLQPSEFYVRMSTDPRLPTTSAPSPADYLLACERLVDRGCSEVVIVTLSAKLSRAVDSARLAAREASVPVVVVDSQTAAAAEGLVARAGARLAAKGASAQEVATYVEGLLPHAGLLAVIPDLEYLRRGGRIGRLARFAGQWLGIKPLVTLADGEVGSAGIVKGLPEAYTRMVERLLEVRSAASTLEVAVMEAAAVEEANRLAERVAGEVSPDLLDRVDFTPVMGAHTGPGVVGVGWLAEPAEQATPH